ncbi:MAG TPA: hypothetical protein VMD79_10375 [Solirubrobacteraceae bacterium]|nr:hypothetical protein [Solirubrobacteraceae bacterium]
MSWLLATATTLTAHGKTLAVVHPHQATHTSSGAIALAAIGALVVLGCLAWAVSRLLTIEPRWLLSLRHASAEAGSRASATWAEFSDWARLGR